MGPYTAAHSQDLTSGKSPCCCGDSDAGDKIPLPIAPDNVIEENCCNSGDEIKQGKCCSGTDDNANEDCCNGIEGSDIRDEKDGYGGCCGGMDTVASLPVVDGGGCCDKEARKGQETKLGDGELVSGLHYPSL